MDLPPEFTAFSSRVVGQLETECVRHREVMGEHTRLVIDVYDGGESNVFNRNRRPVCPPCHALENAAFHDREAAKEFAELAKTGAIDQETATATYCRFSGGDSRLEQPNAGQWAKLRALTTTQDILGSSYYFHGEPGTGKTSAARCLLTHAYAMGPIGIQEANAQVMCKDWGLFEPKLAWKWKNATLLLVDDIDKADWGMSTALPGLWDLMNYRSSMGHKTIFTSNLTKTQLGGHLDAQCSGNESMVGSIFDRLRPCLTLEFGGDSMRRET